VIVFSKMMLNTPPLPTILTLFGHFHFVNYKVLKL